MALAVPLGQAKIEVGFDTAQLSIKLVGDVAVSPQGRVSRNGSESGTAEKLALREVEGPIP